MLSIEVRRQLLKELGESLTDEEVNEITELLYQLAHSFVCNEMMKGVKNESKN